MNRGSKPTPNRVCPPLRPTIHDLNAMLIATLPLLATCNRSPDCRISASGAARENVDCRVALTRDGESFYTLVVTEYRQGEVAGYVTMAFTALPTSGTQ